MSEVDRARLKVALARHYAAQRGEVASEAVEELAVLMVAEGNRVRRVQPHDRGTVAFVAAQARYIPAWTWAAQAALVALMVVLGCSAVSAGVAKVAVGVLSAACVLVGVPTVQASKLNGVAELEYACPRDAASVMVARLVVLGCSSALAVALMVAATAASLDASAFDVALWAAPPFFCSCAGALALLRKAAPASAVALSVVWVAGCSSALLVLANAFPEAYGTASLAVWAGAACAALVWLAREVAATLRAVTAGLDAFSPHMADTRN